MTSEYGFTADRDGDTVTIADCMGGGTSFYAGTRTEAAGEMRRYMERVIKEYADEMAEELFDEEDEDEDSDED